MGWEGRGLVGGGGGGCDSLGPGSWGAMWVGREGPSPPGSRLALVGADCVYTFPAHPAHARLLPRASPTLGSLCNLHICSSCCTKSFPHLELLYGRLLLPRCPPSSEAPPQGTPTAQVPATGDTHCPGALPHLKLHHGRRPLPRCPPQETPTAQVPFLTWNSSPGGANLTDALPELTNSHHSGQGSVFKV